MLALGGVLIALTLAALWILPWRMAHDSGGSYYTFNLICDETCYAVKIQPLIDGTTLLNPANGFSDPKIASQFYLEDVCHAFVSLSGLHIITVFWIWRVGFPILLGATILFLSWTCLQRRPRNWNLPLILAAAASLFSILYVLDAFLLPAPAFHWLSRIPTNIEFPISFLVLALLVRFLRKPEQSRATVLAATLLMLTYLRPYAAAPWVVSIAVTAFLMAVKHRISWRVFGVTTAILCAGMIPWLLAAANNGQIQTFRELFERYFHPQTPYFVHTRWPYIVAFAAVIAGLGFALQQPYRLFALTSAAVLAIIPFAGGLFSIRTELLHYLDRFGCFYLPLVLGLGLLCLGQRSAAWTGRKGARSARIWTRSFAALSLAGSAAVAGINLRYDFSRDPLSNHVTIIGEQRFIPAYDWIRENTPGNALFLFDEGVNWEKAAIPDVVGSIWDRTEFFEVVARRRTVYEQRMHGYAISQDDLMQCWQLHYGTFGMPMPEKDYVDALKRFRPTYVFWRRISPMPRGYGVKLNALASVVYFDQFCEVWRLRYSEAAK